MIKISAWVLIVYAGLKFAQVMMAGERGYRQAPVGMGDRLRRGEPWLAVVAIVGVVPLLLVGARYHERKFTAALEAAADCYGRLTVESRRTGIGNAARDHAIYERLRDYRATALDAAAQLDRPPDGVQSMLSEKADRLTRQGVLPADRTRRCLEVVPEQPNA